MKKNLHKAAYPALLCLFLFFLCCLTGCGGTKTSIPYNAGEIVELGQYKGLTVTKMSAEVTDEEVDIKIEADLLGMFPEETELSDELIFEATGGLYSDLESYRKDVKEELIREAEEYAKSAMYIDLWEQVVDNSVIRGEIPADLISQKKETMRTNALIYAESYDLTVEEFINSVLGKTTEEFESEIEEYALKAAKETLVLKAIADKEGLNVTKRELDAGIDTYVETYGYTSRKDFMETINLDEFEEYILESKVQEFIADNAVITEE
ncbi:MAG: hypothetical protein K6G22_05920 [Lachnospiraceae bacterium]|nr:hypothetical protein [Lachnospiraceae bacterium]